MDEELKKIDLLRERTGISYREARELLEETGGDIVEALVRAEEQREKGWTGKLLDKGDEIASHVKTYIKKGNKTKVRLKRGEKTLAEFPMTIGALGILGALASTQLAVIFGVGAVAAAANRVTMEIEEPDGETKVISLDRHRRQE